MNLVETLPVLSLKAPSITLDVLLNIKMLISSGIAPDAVYSHLPRSEIAEYLEKNRFWWREAQSIVNQIRAMGAQVLSPFHPEYPNPLLRLERPPLFLSCLGSPCWKTSTNFLSVVGSRRPARESLLWIEEHLAPVVRGNRWNVVSGAAIGIDQEAHRVSIMNKLPTVAFLPSGLGAVYPSNFRSWIQPIVERGGAILSEYAPRQEIRKYHFQRRNRLIAAMSSAVLVVEARRRSGSTMTAYFCLEHNFNCGVVPGHPASPNFKGSLDLLTSGAQIIRDQEDLIILMSLKPQ